MCAKCGKFIPDEISNCRQWNANTNLVERGQLVLIDGICNCTFSSINEGQPHCISTPRKRQRCTSPVNLFAFIAEFKSFSAEVHINRNSKRIHLKVESMELWCQKHNPRFLKFIEPDGCTAPQRFQRDVIAARRIFTRFSTALVETSQACEVMRRKRI